MLGITENPRTRSLKFPTPETLRADSDIRGAQLAHRSAARDLPAHPLQHGGTRRSDKAGWKCVPAGLAWSEAMDPGQRLAIILSAASVAATLLIAWAFRQARY
jgi:hypothetical protein